MAEQNDGEDREGKHQVSKNRFRFENQKCSLIPDELSGPGDNDVLYGTDNSGNKDFGRDTNRLDYFRVTTIDVHGNKGLSEIPSYGGGTQTQQKSINGVRKLRWWKKIMQCWGR